MISKHTFTFIQMDLRKTISCERAEACVVLELAISNAINDVQNKNI